MAEVYDYIPSIAIGTEVGVITGKSAESFTAGGWSAFLLAITGENPTLIRIPGTNRVQLVLSKNQIVKVQKWMDEQLRLSLTKPRVPPALDIALGPAIIPWALKYMIPAAVVFILAGWFAHSYFSR
jgi:hypothetical protein